MKLTSLFIAFAVLTAAYSCKKESKSLYPLTYEFSGADTANVGVFYNKKQTTKTSCNAARDSALNAGTYADIPTSIVLMDESLLVVNYPLLSIPANYKRVNSELRDTSGYAMFYVEAGVLKSLPYRSLAAIKSDKSRYQRVIKNPKNPVVTDIDSSGLTLDTTFVQHFSAVFSVKE